jgi:hypothetical protein
MAEPIPDVNGSHAKDISDYFAAGGDAWSLDDHAESAPLWTPEQARNLDPWLALVEDGADLQARELPPVIHQ